jgi:predicted short-subunit dehydrogenase-like oxidoreductase (DUF2520 family)
MIKIAIIGSGNVAQHLIKAFAKCNGVNLIQVFARNRASLLHLIESDKIISDFSQLQEADLFIIAVTDAAIPEVSNSIPFQNKLVVHTSGASSMDNLSDKNRKGVFYPLQTFSKDKAVNFADIPLCLEAQNTEDFEILQNVAFYITKVIYPINSEQRKALHVAAVFVNNFTNHLYQLGSDICEEHQVPFEILRPLIRETADKIETLSPAEAQTGPARRNDTGTIITHLQFLSTENQKNIYKTITQSIQNNDKKL